MGLLNRGWPLGSRVSSGGRESAWAVSCSDVLGSPSIPIELCCVRRVACEFGGLALKKVLIDGSRCSLGAKGVGIGGCAGGRLSKRRSLMRTSRGVVRICRTMAIRSWSGRFCKASNSPLTAWRWSSIWFSRTWLLRFKADHRLSPSSASYTHSLRKDAQRLQFGLCPSHFDLRFRHAWHALSINTRFWRLEPGGLPGPGGVSLRSWSGISPEDPRAASKGRPAADIQAKYLFASIQVM